MDMLNNIKKLRKNKWVVVLLILTIFLTSFLLIWKRKQSQIKRDQAADWVTDSSLLLSQISWTRLDRNSNTIEDFAFKASFEHPANWKLDLIGKGELNINGKASGVAVISPYKKNGRSNSIILSIEKKSGSSWRASEYQPIKVGDREVYIISEEEIVVDWHSIPEEERPKQQDVRYELVYNWEESKYPEYYFTADCNGSVLDKEVVRGACLRMIETLELE